MPCAARRTLAKVKSRAIKPRQPEVPNLITEVIGSAPANARGASMFPVERALLQRVDVADKENPEERHHREKDHISRRFAAEHLAINHRPRIKEHDFDVEEDEQHRHEIKFYRHPRVAFADG